MPVAAKKRFEDIESFGAFVNNSTVEELDLSQIPNTFRHTGFTYQNGLTNAAIKALWDQVKPGERVKGSE